MNTAVASHRLSADQLDELHRVAHNAYLQGRYDEAARYFWFITLHAPAEARYLKGLGASLFMDRAFGQATIAYRRLLQLAPDDPEACCMYGNTLLMLGDREQARKLLELAVRLPGSAPDIHARARALLDLIDR